MIVFYCKLWSKPDVLWKDANWKWPECPSANISPPGVDASTLIPTWQLEEDVPWNPYITSSLNKQKKIIKLICKIKNIEYNEERELRDFNLTVDNIRIIKSENNIDLNLKLEE